jgi:RNA methyltransferase, TrmH family
MLSKNQIKEIQSLHLKKYRDARKLFIAEGIKTVTELIAHPLAAVENVYATANFISGNRALLSRSKTMVVEVTDEELKKISLQQSPNEVLATCRYFKNDDISFDPDKEFSFYLDDIRDPGNMGTILRVADWFGCRVIFCSRDSCDFYNPKVIQASMGAFLRVKVVYTDLEKLVTGHKIDRVYGALLNGKNIYTEKLQPGIMIIGNEANGISKINQGKINHPVTIPAARTNGTESLNAAMAASIIASEFFRQLGKFS